jgi:hypothetical protein
VSELSERAMVSLAAGQVELAASTRIVYKVSNNHVGDASQILNLVTELKILRFSPRTVSDQGAVILDDTMFIKINTRFADFWLLFISPKARKPIHLVVGTVSSREEVTRL